MGNAYGRVCGVHALPPMAAGTIDINLEIFIVDVHFIRCVDLWHNFYKCKARLSEAIGIKWTKSYKSMNAVL